MKKATGLISLSLLILLAAGCTSSQTAAPPVTKDSDAKQENVKQDPVTLNLLIQNPALSQEEFQALIAEPLKVKYPHITVNVTMAGKEVNFDHLITSGDLPDFVYDSLYLSKYLETDYALDLTDQMKKHNMDLSKVYPEIVDGIKNFGDGKIYQIPWMNQSFALFYNKDIFDKFGMEYPKDGMTWEEAIQLGKKMTQKVDGTQYYGLGVPGGRNPDLFIFSHPLSIEMWDPKTEKAIVSEDWKMPMELLSSYFGKEEYRLCQDCKGYYDLFLEGTLAMWPYWTTHYMGELEKRGGNINWDVAQVPSFPQSKNKYYQVDYHGFIVNKATKHLDEVMDVLKLTLSDEVQTKAAKMGTEPARKDLANQFLVDAPFAKGKHIPSIYKSGPAKLIKQSKYNNAVIESLNVNFRKLLDGQQDINTALRTAKEEADKKIETLKK